MVHQIYLVHDVDLRVNILEEEEEEQKGYFNEKRNNYHHEQFVQLIQLQLNLMFLL